MCWSVELFKKIFQNKVTGARYKVFFSPVPLMLECPQLLILLVHTSTYSHLLIYLHVSFSVSTKFSFCNCLRTAQAPVHLSVGAFRPSAQTSRIPKGSMYPCVNTDFNIAFPSNEKSPQGPNLFRVTLAPVSQVTILTNPNVYCVYLTDFVIYITNKH